MRKGILTILAIIASLVPTSVAINYKTYCSLDSKTEYVTYNDETGTFDLPSEIDTKSESGLQKYPAKRCSCSSQHGGAVSYCLATRNENICAIPLESNKYKPVCYEGTTSAVFIRNVWPVVVLWFAAMAFYLISTDAGRGTLKFALSRICRCESLSNHRLVNEIVTREMNFHRQRERERNRASNALRMAEEGGGNVVTYILKTKAHKSYPKSPTNTEPSTPDTSLKSSLSDDGDFSPNDGIDGESLSYGEAALTTPSKDDEETAVGIEHYLEEDVVTCSICMMEIEDGERIGALECDHKFHVDCLKEWIKRRNVCPLCQTPDIATLKTNRSENQSEDSSTTPTQRTFRRVGLSPTTNAERDSTRSQLFHVNSDGSPAFSRRRIETNTIRIRDSLGRTSNTRMNLIREEARQRER